MATDSENRHYDLAAGDNSAFDELAARAGAAVRRPAPEHGAAEAVRRGQRRRVATAFAAGGVTIVLVVVGVAVLRDGTNPEPSSPVATTTADNSVDSAVARAALISVDQLGPGWSPEFTPTSLEPWRAATAAQPECAEYIAAVEPLEATAPGGLASFINVQNQIASEALTIYPSKEAASSVMDSMEAPGFKDCFFATFDAENSRGFPGSGPTTRTFDIAAPAAHGDRQIAFGQETRTAVDSRTRLYHDIWIQVGRSIILIIVSPDGLGSDNPAGLTDKSITAAIASLTAALPAE